MIKIFTIPFSKEHETFFEEGGSPQANCTFFLKTGYALVL
jgi:hypothetical protein